MTEGQPTAAIQPQRQRHRRRARRGSVHSSQEGEPLVAGAEQAQARANPGHESETGTETESNNEAGASFESEQPDSYSDEGSFSEESEESAVEGEDRYGSSRCIHIQSTRVTGPHFPPETYTKTLYLD